MTNDKKIKKDKDPVADSGDLSDKKKAAEAAMQQIRQMYGEGAIMKFGEAQNTNVDVVSTGCLSLDLALGVGGTAGSGY